MADRPPDGDTGVRPTADRPPSTPRWVKVFGIVVIVLVLLFGGLKLFGVGGGHGPGMPMQMPMQGGGGGGDAPPAGGHTP